MNVLPLLTAFTAGLAHAIEPDHVAAVTTFVSRRPRPLEAVGFGLRWGIGHSAAILGVGGILIALDLRLSDHVTRGLEFGVGVMLLGLGVWLLWNVLHERAHRLAGGPEHASGAHGHHHHPHHHGRGTLWVGLAHGLAGTAPFIAVIPVALVKSPWQAGAYLLLFGVGTTVAMGLYALVAGLVFHHAGSRVPALGGALRAATALGSAALGVVWMVSALAA